MCVCHIEQETLITRWRNVSAGTEIWIENCLHQSTLEDIAAESIPPSLLLEVFDKVRILDKTPKALLMLMCHEKDLEGTTCPKSEVDVGMK